jgi:hypothetical protein
MSVLIEGITLVVRRLSTDIGYPGGANAFLRATLELEQPPRYVCNGDPLLLNLSFYNCDHVEPAAELLRNAGLIDVDDETQEFVDFALVDQATGPTMPCSWLAWKKQAAGFTIAWDASADIGDLAAPDDWTPKRSRDMTHTDMREDEERLFHLATENGFDTYLDLKTGGISTALSGSLPEAESSVSFECEDTAPAHDASAVEENASGTGPLFRALTTGFKKLDWHATLVKDPVAIVELTGQLAIYRCRYVVREEAFVISCVTRAPLLVPESARPRMMEFITRANLGMIYGAWILDLDEGSLSVRAGLNAEDALVTATMIENLARIGVGTLDRFYPNVLELVEGRISVREALVERVEES